MARARPPRTTCAARGCRNPPEEGRRVCADCAPLYDRVRHELENRGERGYVVKRKTRAAPRLCLIEDCDEKRVEGSVYCDQHEHDV